MKLAARKLLLTATMCSCFSCVGWAQPAIGDYKTPSGLSFRYAQVDKAQYQTIRFAWRGSYFGEGGMDPGLIVLSPALIMQGPRGLARSEFIEDVKDLQASMQLRSRLRVSFGTLRGLPEHFDKAALLFGKVIANPALEQRRLDILRTRYLDRLKRLTSKASVLENFTRSRLYFPPGPVQDLRAGKPSVVKSVTLAMVKAWHKRVLTKKGLLIAAAGKAAPEKVAVHIDALFANLSADGGIVQNSPIKYQPSGKSILLIADVPQTYIRLSTWSDFKDNDEAVLGQLAGRILRLRLFKALREKLGATYGASASFSRPIPDPYMFSLAAAVAHDKAPAALKAMKEELRRFIATGVTDKELEPEKTRLKTYVERGFRKSHLVSGWLLRAMISNRAADTVQTSLTRIAAASAKRVNAALAAKLGGREFLTIVVAPATNGLKGDCIIKAPREVAACKKVTSK